MKKLTVSLLLLTGAAAGFAQKNPEKYAATITAADLKKHLIIVAGAGMEGRETGTEGQKKAAAYIENDFKTLGLRPGNNGSYQQVYPLFQDTILSSRLAVAGKEYQFGRDYTIAAQTGVNKNITAGKLVFAGYGISDSLYNDYASLDVNGAIVVLAPGEPRENNQPLFPTTSRAMSWAGVGRKTQAALSKGAAAVFILSPRAGNLDSAAATAQRRSTLYLGGRAVADAARPSVATISQGLFHELFGSEYADSVLKKLEGTAKFSQADYHTVNKDISFDCQKSSMEKANSSNVLGVLEGTDKKEEYVFMTAHYDHLGTRPNGTIFYGADDDGSGTVSVLEMAEAFVKAKAEGNGPRRTIVFMTVSGEEKGLWGSEYYSEHPLFPLDKTSVDLNTDMVGRLDPKRTYGDSMNYVYVIGDDKLSSDLKPISESINKKYAHLELDYKYNDPKDTERIYFRSDHYNFARKGVPIIFYFNGTHNDYHRPSDTVDKINFDVMQKRVRFIFLTAWEMANRNDMVKRDIPLPEANR